MRIATATIEDGSRVVRDCSECSGDPKSWLVANYCLLAAVLLLALFVRTQRLAAVGVSFDESFTLKMVEFSWPEMLDRITLETQPPLFYAMLKVWQQVFGTSIAAARLLTVTWGVVAVWAMYLFVREAYRLVNASPRQNFLAADLPALVAAMLLALAPIQIFWTLQIRMYSLPIALTLLSSYFLMRALRRQPANPRDWWWYTIVAILLAYSHYFGLFVLVGQYLFAAGFRLRYGEGDVLSRLRPVLLSGCCLWFAWQPWLPFFLQQRDRVDQGFYLREPSWELIERTMRELWIGKGPVISPVSGLFIAQASFLVLLVLLLGRKPADSLIALCASLPVAAALVISSISHPIITARYFQFSQVFVLAAVAVVACRVPHLGRVAAIAVVLSAMGYLCYGHFAWRQHASELPGTRAAVAHFEDAKNGGEPLVVSNPMLYTSVLSYVQDRSDVYNYQPPRGFPFYQGTPVMRDAEYVDRKWIDDRRDGCIWTLDADRSSMGRVPMPDGWRLVGEERFREWFAELILRIYVRDEPANDQGQEQ